MLQRLTFALCGAALAWGQTALSLEQAIDLAVQQNRRVEIAKLEIQKAGEAVEAAKTLRLPHFNFNALGGQFLTPLNFNFPAGVFGVFPSIGPVPATTASVTTPRRPFGAVQAGVAQPLTQQIRIGLGMKAENLNRQVAEERLRLEEQSVVNDVKKVYYNLLQTQSALRATEATVELFKEMDRVAGNALKEQAILRSDLLEAEAGLAKAEAEAAALRDTSDTLHDHMNSLLGQDLSTAFSLSTKLEEKPWEYDLATTRQRALDQRPEVREARLKIQLAETDLRAKRAQYIPDVSVRLDYLSFPNVQALPTNTAAVSVVAQWDVFDWGRKRHEMAEKSMTVHQAQTAVDEAVEQIQVEVGQSFRKLQMTQLQLRADNLAMEAGQEKVRVALNRYEQGAILLQEVLRLRVELADKTFRYQETLSNFWNARADLERASGER